MSDMPLPVSRNGRKMPPVVRWVTLCLVVVWLALVAGLGWWMSHQAEAAWLDRTAAGADADAQATARVVDRLFAEMTSVTNMVAHQAQVIQLASRYRIDPPAAASLTRAQRAAQFSRDPLVRKVGDFMDALAGDLRYARIYMNNLSDDTVTASNWAEADSIVGMIYSGRTYLIDALRDGNGHSFGIARLNKSPSYFVSSRIEDAHGVPLGSVTVKFNADEMATYLTGRHLALIVNSQGRVTTTSWEPFMLRNVAALLPQEVRQRPGSDEGPGQPLDVRPLAGYPHQWLIDGKPYLVQRQDLANTRYQLLMLASLDRLGPMRRQHVLAAVLVAALGLVLILLASHAVGQMVMRNLEARRASLHVSALNRGLSAALSDAKTKNRQKAEVLGYIGHDLRAPLATIKGYSALLLADAPEQHRTLLHTIQRSVKYQLDLIDELLEYTKAELQPLTVTPVPTDLPKLLDDLSHYAVALCAQRHNRFHCHCSGRLPRIVELDGKRLQQVLLNLLSNAAKFTRDGAVTLSVTAKPEGQACALHFAVSDTGIGIDLNRNVDIFSAFQQLHAEGGGSGLGLFIAQHILSAMGASLTVDSVPGQGTTFSFALRVPVLGPADSAWLVVPPSEPGVAGTPPQPELHREAMPEAQALEELAGLSLHGRFTDIKLWIERHANSEAHAPFMDQLRGLLERFDFSGIHALALQGRSGAAPPPISAASGAGPESQPASSGG